MLDRIWGWFQRAGIDFGVLPNRIVPMKWTPPPFESIDRMGDAEADILEMQAGLESRQNLLASRGYDHDDMMTAIADDQKLLKDLKLAFKGDPFSPAQMNTTDPNADSPDSTGVRALRRLLSRLTGSEQHA